MDIGTIVSLIGLGIGLLSTIAGIFVAFGRLSEKIKNMEERSKEDREKNDHQHMEFYTVRDSTISLETKFESFSDRLKEVESGIKEILSRLPAHRRDGEQ